MSRSVSVSVALVGVWLGRSVSLSVKEFTHFVTEAAAGRFDLIGSTASQDEISLPRCARPAWRRSSDVVIPVMTGVATLGTVFGFCKALSRAVKPFAVR